MVQYDIRMDKQKKLTLVTIKSVEEEIRILSPEDFHQALNVMFDIDNLAEEHVYMFAVSTKNEVIGAFEVSAGGVACAYTEISGLLKRALLCNASGIMMAHNHPSGWAEASSTDIDYTKRLNEACKLIQINLIDSVVVARNGEWSAREKQII